MSTTTPLRMIAAAKVSTTNTTAPAQRNPWSALALKQHACKAADEFSNREAEQQAVKAEEKFERAHGPPTLRVQLNAISGSRHPNPAFPSANPGAISPLN